MIAQVEECPVEENPWTAIALTRITLNNFRCYTNLRLELDTAPVVLTGPNGAGKTNLLEAISFLLPGRGLRRARLHDITGINRLEKGALLNWTVSASLCCSDVNTEIGTGFKITQDFPENGRRIAKLNGEEAPSLSTLSEVFSCIWLVPEMDRLFVEAASARRRFLDRLVTAFDSAHSRRLGVYEKAMRERTKILRSDSFGNGVTNQGWLNVIEKQMAETGVAIAAARRAFMERLILVCQAEVGPFPGVEVELIGDIEHSLETHSALEVEESIGQQLCKNRDLDREAGRALIGVHRSDIHVRHFSKNIEAARCSTGEQKALLIRIILAHARLIALHRGTVPVLLLDEVVAHLDAERRSALFQEIAFLGAQAWLTGTDRMLFNTFGDNAQFFRVDEGAIRID